MYQALANSCWITWVALDAVKNALYMTGSRSCTRAAVRVPACWPPNCVAHRRSRQTTACESSRDKVGVVSVEADEREMIPRYSEQGHVATALPRVPFADLASAKRWVVRLVDWYNAEHRHSAIRYSAE